MYAEDLDLCWRLHRRGWDVAFDPGVEVVHVGNAAGAVEFGAGRIARVTAVEHEWYRSAHGEMATRAWAGATVAGLGAKWVVATALGRRETASHLRSLIAQHREAGSRPSRA